MILNYEDFKLPKAFLEVEVNGEQVGDDDEGGTPPADYTTPEPVNAAGADDALPAEDAPAPEEGGDEPPTDEGGEDVDYTDGGDEPPADEGGGEDMDYTDGGGSEGGDEPPPDDGGGTPSGGSGEVQADDARGVEKEIFKDLTPNQIDMKHKELKSNFTALYDATTNIIDRVNEIPTSEEYIATISFVSEQLSNLRKMVADYMNDVYSTKSYMENAMNYNKFLATLKGINDILDEVNKELGKEEPK